MKSKTKFAAFDIDGTIFRWQLYHDLFDEFVREGIIDEKEAEPIFAARDKWRQREESCDDYEHSLIKVMEMRIIGLPSEVVDKAADTILQKKGLQVYGYTSNLIKELKGRGYTILAISGSHQQLIERFAQIHGIDITYGRQHTIENGVLTEEVRVVYGRKAEILRELVEKHNLDWEGSYAIGDTNSDADMMELVANPIAFNPDSKLYQRALKERWKIVVERKNVIYELEDNKGNFLLKEK
jgi:HAD superfamily hydrolase (TIGR01490 family)